MAVTCSSVLRVGEHPQQTEHRERGRVQLCPLIRVFPTQEPHVPRVWDAGAEPLRLPKTQQVQPADAQVHTAHPAAGRHGPDEAEEPRPDPRRPEAGEHYAGGPSEAAVQS